MVSAEVFSFRKYDIVRDEYHTFLRWGTRDAIAALEGLVMEGQSIMVDPAVLGREITGTTERNFVPNPRTGFQTFMRT
jgi:hypothetical protein